MDLLIRALIFAPVALLVMIVYVAPQHAEPRPLLEAAVQKTGKVLLWTAVLIVAMQAIHLLFLP